jgi:hypothetical protein
LVSDGVSAIDVTILDKSAPSVSHISPDLLAREPPARIFDLDPEFLN